MANVTVTIRTVDDQLTPVPIDDVLVRVFDSTGLVFITSGLTGAVVPGSGEVQFSLPGTVGGVSYKAQLYKESVSFLPAPTKDFHAKDPPAGPDMNVFQYEGHDGLVGAVVTFVVQDTASPTPNPVEDARIRVFASPADTYITEVASDANGTAEIVLEGAAGPTGKEYIIRVNTPVGYYDGPTKVIGVIDPLAVGETNIFDFIAYPPPATPTTADIDMCRVSGFFTDPSLRPLKNLTLIFHPREGYPARVPSGAPYSGQPTVVRNRIIASERRVNTDKNGYIELDLPRESVFDVYVQGLDAGDHTLLASVCVPDMAGISVHEILFPYVTKVTYTTPTLTLAVGETGELELELELSNYQSISGKAALDALLLFSSVDAAVASVAGVSAEGKVLVVGGAVGSTTVTTARVSGSYAPRRPTVPDLIVSPAAPTITVT